MALTPQQEQLCADSPYDFSGLKAMFINCTLKPSPETSNTDGLMDVSRAIMEKNGIAVTSIRAVDHDIAYGVYPDMREHGFKSDAFPDLWPKILAADILVLGSPIWLGQYSAVCKLVIERLYGMSAELNDKGQWIYYGKTGGWRRHRQRGRGQALRDGDPLFAAAPRLRHPAAGGIAAGSGRSVPGPPISTKARADRRATSPSATRPS